MAWPQKGLKTPTNDSFVALTQCDELVLRKFQKNAKKIDMVKIENHCTKKFRFGYIILSHRGVHLGKSNGLEDFKMVTHLMLSHKKNRCFYWT